MAFEFSAFNLTAGERHATLGDIKVLLHQIGAQIRRAEKSKHADDDYADALLQVDDVLALASDPDACDPSQAPLATCHLYRGQILFSLGWRAEAYEAFKLAASSGTRAVTDAPAARDAAARLLRLRSRAKRPPAHTGNSVVVLSKSSVEDQINGLDQAQKEKLAAFASKWADRTRVPAPPPEPPATGPGSGLSRRRTVIVEKDGQVSMVTPGATTTT